MLSREFKSAEELGIDQQVYDALVDFTQLEKLEDFDMGSSRFCICAFVLQHIVNGYSNLNPFKYVPLTRSLYAKAYENAIFSSPLLTELYSGGRGKFFPLKLTKWDWGSITFRHAQEATRNALMFGDPRWEDVMSSQPQESPDGNSRDTSTEGQNPESQYISPESLDIDEQQSQDRILEPA